MIRSRAFLALLGIYTAIACSDDADGTGTGGALPQTGASGGTGAGAGGGGGSVAVGGKAGTGGSTPAGGKAGTSGAGGGTAGSGGVTGGSAGKSCGLGGADNSGTPFPTTPTKAVIPGASGCDVHGIVWQSDARASVFLSCGMSQTLDGGVTFGPPQTSPVVNGYGGFFVSGDSFAALEDGSLLATTGSGGVGAESGNGTCTVFRSDPSGTVWYAITSTQGSGTCEDRTAVAARGDTAYFTSRSGTTYTVSRIAGCEAQSSQVPAFGQSTGIGGEAAMSTQPDVGFPPLIEEGGAVWAYSLRSLSRRAAGAPIGAYGPTLAAPKQAGFIGLNGQQVAWVADGALYAVPTNAPDFGSPLAVPGLVQKGDWQGAADESGRIVIVETAYTDPSQGEIGPLKLATLRPDAKTLADVHGFATSPDLPDATKSVGSPQLGARFRVALRKGRLLVAATNQGEVVVHGLSPSF